LLGLKVLKLILLVHLTSWSTSLKLLLVLHGICTLGEPSTHHWLLLLEVSLELALIHLRIHSCKKLPLILRWHICTKLVSKSGLRLKSLSHRLDHLWWTKSIIHSWWLYTSLLTICILKHMTRLIGIFQKICKIPSVAIIKCISSVECSWIWLLLVLNRSFIIIPKI